MGGLRIALKAVRCQNTAQHGEGDDMARLNLDYEELQEVVRLCRWLPPGWDLKRFLLGHLRYRLPATAAKIETLEEDEITTLREQIAARRRMPQFEPSKN
jgi:hypothetical protein